LALGFRFQVSGFSESVFPSFVLCLLSFVLSLFSHATENRSGLAFSAGPPLSHLPFRLSLRHDNSSPASGKREVKKAAEIEFLSHEIGA